VTLLKRAKPAPKVKTITRGVFKELPKGTTIYCCSEYEGYLHDSWEDDSIRFTLFVVVQEWTSLDPPQGPGTPMYLPYYQKIGEYIKDPKIGNRFYVDGANAPKLYETARVDGYVIGDAPHRVVELYGELLHHDPQWFVCVDI
jgi:hypothetical protein